MKTMFKSMLLAVILVATMPLVSQPIDPPSEGTTILAQRFCPNGRC